MVGEVAPWGGRTDGQTDRLSGAGTTGSCCWWVAQGGFIPGVASSPRPPRPKPFFWGVRGTRTCRGEGATLLGSPSPTRFAPLPPFPLQPPPRRGAPGSREAAAPWRGAAPTAPLLLVGTELPPALIYGPEQPRRQSRDGNRLVQGHSPSRHLLSPAGFNPSRFTPSFSHGPCKTPTAPGCFHGATQPRKHPQLLRGNPPGGKRLGSAAQSGRALGTEVRGCGWLPADAAPAQAFTPRGKPQN